MSTTYQIGDKIQNRWEVRNILAGGMGTVYIVYDSELKEALAAKTFQDIYLPGQNARDRFTQEALAWVNLDIHYNVTEARFVENIEGKPYIFLEYISGGDLSSWIGTPRLTENLEQVVLFAIHCCDGLIHAYSKGISAHGDIKPKNCLITENNVLKVTDFGLSSRFNQTPDKQQNASIARDEFKPASHNELNDPTLNRQRTVVGYLPPFLSKDDDKGDFIGTMEYMAPEQFTDGEQLTEQTDIYSLGIMLFEMISGQLPFQGRTPVEFREMHLHQSPPRLKTSVPLLNTIIQRCLSKKPEDRYQNMGALREILAECYQQVASKPPPAQPTGDQLLAYQHLNRGNSLSKLGENHEALERYNQASVLEPNNADIWHNTAVVLIQEKEMRAAYECNERCMQLDPNKSGVWVNKGNILFVYLSQPQPALECFDKAITLNPHDDKAWYNKGQVFSSLNKLEEALECYNHVLHLDPKKDDAWFMSSAKWML